jgi:amino acid adenylation domain-containing protein
MQNTEIIGFPLSPQQKRIFSLDAGLSVHPYVTRAKLVIEGLLDRQKLERSLAEVVERHEALRTRFVQHPALKTLLQVIVPEVSTTLELLETALPDGGDGSGVEPPLPQFDLSSGGGFRCALAQITPEKGFLFLTVASVCGDAWSCAKIANDLAVAYRRSDAESQGQRDEDPLQYADVAEHFNSVLQSEIGSLGQQYWQPRITTPGPDVASSLGQNRSAENFSPEVARAHIPAQVLEKVCSAFSAERHSEELPLLACWQWLLQLTSGEDEFAVGYAASGRDTPELASSVGPFETYLPLTLGSPSNRSFSELVEDVSHAVREALRWQRSFQWPEAEKFLPVCFSYYDASWIVASGDIKISCSSLSPCSDRFDLKLSCVKSSSCLQIELWYEPSRYPEREAKQLLSQFVTLVEDVASSPRAPLSSLNVISQQERQELLRRTSSDAPKIRIEGVVARIEEQARNYPNLAAVEYGGRQLTYSELSQRANQLGHFLNELGVGPEVRVGICLERGLELLIGLLGILKVGGAYVPLDPNHPSERLTYMLEDAQARVLLTQESLKQKFQSLAIPVICQDSDQQAIASQSKANPRVDIYDQNLAYVIYTSGSTGTPKGVGVTMGGLRNYVNWASSAYECKPGSRTPLYSSLGFDLTVTSIWPLLVSAGCVVVIPENSSIETIIGDGLRDPWELVKVTPAHLQMLKEVLPEQSTAVSRRFVIGGEALRWEELSYWLQYSPGAKLVNEYGPTETVVGSCAYEICGRWEEEGRVPIGQAIANTRVYVVDRWGRLAPTGAPGELYIGGAGVAHGYLNQPAMTAEKFVPDSFSTFPGERLYRTYDLARWRADGQLEYLKRMDDQLKIRGYRIEPGEVEGVLIGHSSVKNAAVLARPDALGNNCLVAYVVPARGAEKPGWEQLKTYLRTKLPEYMLPAAYVELEELPLTLNGKLDHNALPSPEWMRKSQKASYVSPRNLTEELMVGIWAGVLKLERVGVEDNFFDLGGHSILATQVISRLRSAFGVELPLGVLFELPTIALLAQRLEQQESDVEDLLAEVESLSEEEIQSLLSAEEESA